LTVRRIARPFRLAGSPLFSLHSHGQRCARGAMKGRFDGSSAQSSHSPPSGDRLSHGSSPRRDRRESRNRACPRSNPNKRIRNLGAGALASLATGPARWRSPVGAALAGARAVKAGSLRSPVRAARFARGGGSALTRLVTAGSLRSPVRAARVARGRGLGAARLGRAHSLRSCVRAARFARQGLGIDVWRFHTLLQKTPTKHDLVIVSLPRRVSAPAVGDQSRSICQHFKGICDGLGGSSGRSDVRRISRTRARHLRLGWGKCDACLSRSLCCS